jgi:hypothetical protein
MRLNSEPPPLLFPTSIVTQFKNQTREVVSVSGTTPRIEIDGKLRSLPYNQRYLPVRADGFAPGGITISNLRGRSTVTNLLFLGPGGTRVSGGVIDSRSDFEAKLVASQTYDKCYAVLVLFDQNFLEGSVDYPAWEFVFHAIGTLKTGAEKHVEMSIPMVQEKTRRLGCILLVFCGGLEIRSNLSDSSALLFRRVEVAEHAQLLKNYLQENQGADRPLKPCVRIVPELPKDVQTETLPKLIHVALVVTAEGTVEYPEIEEELPPAADKAIRRAISDWLFLPRLQAGLPVRAKVTIPIGIASTASAAP